MLKKTLISIPVIILLAACSSTLESKDGNDLTNVKPSTGTEKPLDDDLSLTLGDDFNAEKMPSEDETPTDPQYPELVSVDEPVINVPLDQDTSNYYLYDDNFNNTSITIFTKDSYPSIPEVGQLKELGDQKYIEGWLEHVKATYEHSPVAEDIEHGFLNWDDGARGAYVSYHFAVPGMSPELAPVPDDGTEPVDTGENYMTEMILIKDGKVLTSGSTSQTPGLPKYLQSLKF